MGIQTDRNGEKREMDDRCLVYQFGVAYFDSKKTKWI